jgi:hypothetical protein
MRSLKSEVNMLEKEGEKADSYVIEEIKTSNEDIIDNFNKKDEKSTPHFLEGRRVILQNPNSAECTELDYKTYKTEKNTAGMNQNQFEADLGDIIYDLSHPQEKK